jgi:hypothetical protein
MQLEKKKPIIQIEDIFAKTDDYSIYRYYLGEFKVNGNISSPFRKDNNPSFGVYMKDGRLFHNDMGDATYHGDCIALVQQLFGISYKEAIEKVAKDFGISGAGGCESCERVVSSYTKPVLEQKRYTIIRCTVKSKFTKAEAEYWASFGITPERCKAEDIYSVKEWSLNGFKQDLEKGELCFGYLFPGVGWKIYRPFASKENKWKGNVDMTIVENKAAIASASKVLITKARKDRLVLSSLLPGWTLVNVQNESELCYTKEFVESLSGKEVVVNYDSDPAGKKASLLVTKKYGFRHINVPDKYLEEGIKDLADLYKKYGPEPIITHFKNKQLI